MNHEFFNPHSPSEDQGHAIQSFPLDFPAYLGLLDLFIRSSDRPDENHAIQYQNHATLKNIESHSLAPTQLLEDVRLQNFLLHKQNQELLDKIQELHQQNQELQSKIEFLVSQESQREQEQILREQKKLQRQQAKKYRQRASVSLSEFTTILPMVEIVEKHSFVAARVRVALTLLFYTGLRESNLLLLTDRHMYDLMTSGETVIPLIKRGSDRHMICIGTQGKKALQDLENDILILHPGELVPNDNFFFISSRTQDKLNSKPIAREVLDKQLNRVLEYASTILQKHIRSHSFRYSYITALLDSGVAIEKVKDVIGHKDIGTTSNYRTSKVGVKELRQLTSKLSNSRKEKNGLSE